MEALYLALLENSSSLLRDCPCRFRAVRVEGGTILMSTPPVQFRMIPNLYPHLPGRLSASPESITARQGLVQVQSKTRGIAMQQPGISKIEWTWAVMADPDNIPLN